MLTLTVLSLFSGAGGLDVGFEEAGYRVVWANEHDHDAAETWRMNRPGNADAMHEGDVMSPDIVASLPPVGSVDVIVGGPPCQSWSIGGKMLGEDDPRGQLIWAYLDVVSHLRPRAFVLENVAALARLSKWEPVRDGIARKVAGMGYALAFRVFDASRHGVCQKRERAFFVGIRNDLLDAPSGGCPQPVSPDSVLDSVDALARPLTLTCRDVLDACGKYGSDANPVTSTAKISLCKNPSTRKTAYNGMLLNGRGRPVDLSGTCPTMCAIMGGNATPVVDMDEYADRSGKTENWFAGYLRRLVDGRTTPSTETIPKGRLRRLTLVECSAFQSFPSGYRFSGSTSKQYRQVGNAVPPLLAKDVAIALRTVLETGKKATR